MYMVQFKMRVINKPIPCSNPNRENKNNKESEFNCYICFKIMILDLWSEDQEGPGKIHVHAYKPRTFCLQATGFNVLCRSYRSFRQSSDNNIFTLICRYTL